MMMMVMMLMMLMNGINLHLAHLINQSLNLPFVAVY